MDPHSIELFLDADLGCVELRHSSLHVGPFASVHRSRGPPCQKTGRLDLGRHVGNLELDCLEFTDWPAECMSRTRVRKCAIKTGLCDADRSTSDVDTTELK